MKQNLSDEEYAKTHLKFAFVLNSLFFAMCRVQGKEMITREEPTNVSNQLQKIKGYFKKVD